jgi:hypothetical protein
MARPARAVSSINIPSPKQKHQQTWNVPAKVPAFQLNGFQTTPSGKRQTRELQSCDETCRIQSVCGYRNNPNQNI